MPGLARPTFFPPPLSPSSFFSSSSFPSSSLFFLSFLFPFSPLDRYRPLILDYFHRCARLSLPSLPLAKKNGNSRGPVHGFLVNFAATSANEHDTKKRIRPCNRAIFVAPSTCRKKEGSVCIYVFYYIRIFCSIGRRSGAILEIM